MAKLLFPGFMTDIFQRGQMFERNPCQRSCHQCVPDGDVFESIMGDFLSTLLPGLDQYGHRMSLCDPRRQMPRLWVHFLKIKGYKPEEIKLKMDGNKMYLNAKHEQRNGEDIDIYETKRSVLVPSDVDTTKIKCHMLDDDTLMLQAPRIVIETPEKKPEAPVLETKTVPEVITVPVVYSEVTDQNDVQNKPEKEQSDAQVIPTEDKTSTHDETIQEKNKPEGNTKENDELETRQVPAELDFCVVEKDEAATDKERIVMGSLPEDEQENRDDTTPAKDEDQV